MKDRLFTNDDIRNHHGSVEVFCPKVKHEDSRYEPIQVSRETFIERLSQPGAFKPVGRIEGTRMLICLLPSGFVGNSR